MNKHKLDLFVEDLNTVNYLVKDENQKLLIQTVFNVKVSDKEYRSSIRLDISKITIFFKSFSSYDELDSIRIDNLKNDWYREILLYIMYTRLPIWKESIESLKKLI